MDDVGPRAVERRREIHRSAVARLQAGHHVQRAGRRGAIVHGADRERTSCPSASRRSMTARRCQCAPPRSLSRSETWRIRMVRPIAGVDYLHGRTGRDRERRRASRDRRPERLLPGRRPGRGGRRPGGARGQPAGRAFSPRAPHAGLASARARVLRVEPSRTPALRDDPARLRRAGAVARPLHPGHPRRRVPPRAGHAQGGAGRAQGPQPRHRFLLRALRERPPDPDRPRSATCASAGCAACSWPGWPPTSACSIRASTPAAKASRST